MRCRAPLGDTAITASISGSRMPRCHSSRWQRYVMNKRRAQCKNLSASIFRIYLLVTDQFEIWSNGGKKGYRTEVGWSEARLHGPTVQRHRHVEKSRHRARRGQEDQERRKVPALGLARRQRQDPRPQRRVRPKEANESKRKVEMDT